MEVAALSKLVSLVSEPGGRAGPLVTIKTFLNPWVTINTVNEKTKTQTGKLRQGMIYIQYIRVKKTMTSIGMS